MKWDQIESKWALMTRRIRADIGAVRGDASEGSVQALRRRDKLTATIADSLTAAGSDSEFKTSAK